MERDDQGGGAQAGKAVFGHPHRILRRGAIGKTLDAPAARTVASRLGDLRMRAIGLLAAAALISLVTAAREAKADTMDPALARFVTDSNCRTKGPAGNGQYYNPSSGYVRCGTDDLAFAHLIAQYGFAVAPTAMHSARTTGFGYPLRSGVQKTWKGPALPEGTEPCGKDPFRLRSRF